MLPDRVSNPGPLTYESSALPIALRGPAHIDYEFIIRGFLTRLFKYYVHERSRKLFSYFDDFIHSLISKSLTAYRNLR